jgi:putative heme-binding domain-containing protein
MFPSRILLFCLGSWVAADAAFAQDPEWIWHSKTAGHGEVRYFRKTFQVPATLSAARLSITCDNHANAFINGKAVAEVKSWESPVRVDVRDALRRGENVIAVVGRNDDGIAGLLAKLELTFENKAKAAIITNGSWISSERETAGWNNLPFTPAGWTTATVHGALGMAPWGNVFAANAARAARPGPATELKTAPGFSAEMIYPAQAGQGSWIAMTLDPQGRIIVSPQNRAGGASGGMLRITLSRDERVERVEALATPLTSAMGLLWAFDSLYVDGDGPQGFGLYRLHDADRDDQFDRTDFLLPLGNGEHGSHGIVLGPDKSLYLMVGNHVKVPSKTLPTSPLRNFAEDMLLPRQWDANGHAVGILAPGGYVIRSADQGQTWELFCGGFRNSYDLDFNRDGELFTFDSDMEWDMGAPWYKPTRILHCVSGGEYGWRSGTGNWPVYYPDALPAVVDIGAGSPTGVKFPPRNSTWPAAYREALFAMDWAYGKIYAVHPRSNGSSTYTGTAEEFVSGKPLNVTDMEFAGDTLWFITGGRGTQSALYRVKPATPPVAKNSEPPDEKAGAARALRRSLEKFHGHTDRAAVETAWPHLDSPDPFLRGAARVAIEWQPVHTWQQRALDEKRPQATLEALLALARCGDREIKPHLCEGLTTLTLEQMSEEQLLSAIRIAGLVFIRLGKPNADEQRQMIDLWSRFFPAKTERLNRELSQLLVYLEAPEATRISMELMRAAPSQEEQMHYALVLRNARAGWTPAMRRTYFEWFVNAKRNYKGGASFQKFLVNIARDAADTVRPDERVALADLLDAPAAAPKKPATTVRGFVRMWKLNDLLSLADAGKGDATRGKRFFEEAQCLACHRFGREGGAVGPDLTGAAARFNRRDLLEAIVEPSKVVSDQYRNVTFSTKQGKQFTGRVLDQNATKIVIAENPLTNDRTEIALADVAKREESPVSTMPEGLLSLFSKEEIIDLLTYLESGVK